MTDGFTRHPSYGTIAYWVEMHELRAERGALALHRRKVDGAARLWRTFKEHYDYRRHLDQDGLPQLIGLSVGLGFYGLARIGPAMDPACIPRPSRPLDIIAKHVELQPNRTWLKLRRG